MMIVVRYDESAIIRMAIGVGKQSHTAMVAFMKVNESVKIYIENCIGIE